METPLWNLVSTAVVMSLMIVGCASTPHRPLPKQFTSNRCSEIYPTTQENQLNDQLDKLSDLFGNACFSEVITLGNYLRKQGHDKFYQMTSEFAEIFTPEGTFSEYTMESYERAYLSLLIAMSYYNLHQETEVMVELRRSLEEDSSVIYNYGSDPVVDLLLAAIWDRYDPATARPYWKKLSETKYQDPQIVKMARARLVQIDAGDLNRISWRVYGIGRLPEMDWHSDFIMRKKGPYKIAPKTEFPPFCATAESLLAPTSSWAEKIGIKYQGSYHPFLFAKSLVRLPIGIGYGVVGVTGSFGIGIGGCALGAYGNSRGGGEFCEASLRAAGYLMGKSTDLVEFVLSPDLRHWKKVPMAFYITKEDEPNEVATCLQQNQLLTQRTVFLIE